jgi:STE24 endopeptidase
MLEFIVLVFTIYTFVRLYAAVMQIGYVNDEKRRAPVLMSQAKYLVAGNYTVAKEKLGLIEIFADYLLFFWWVQKGFAWLQGLLQVDGEIIRAVLFLFGFFALNYIVGLPATLYQTFKIDKEFGFNTMTPKLFVIDTLKSLFLFLTIGSLIFAILAWIIINYSSWWIFGFVFLFVVVLFANLLYPTIMALFNKFTPLEDGSLKEAIISMMNQAGLKSDGIFVMDASKRDNRLNAYFGGIGKSKRVVLFDTLLKKMSHNELLAILGHELGHFKHGDIWKNITLTGSLLFVSLYLFGHLPDTLFSQMGVIPDAGVMIAVMTLLLPVVSFIFTPVISYARRHNEYAADRFGSSVGGKKHLVSALLKLVTENKSFPKSHPLIIFLYYTHPPMIERLKALGFDALHQETETTLLNEGIFTFLGNEQNSHDH